MDLPNSDRCLAKYHPAYSTTASAGASSFCLGEVILGYKCSDETCVGDLAFQAMTPNEIHYRQTEKGPLAMMCPVELFD